MSSLRSAPDFSVIDYYETLLTVTRYISKTEWTKNHVLLMRDKVSGLSCRIFDIVLPVSLDRINEVVRWRHRISLC